jgi:hypothetical protein
MREVQDVVLLIYRRQREARAGAVIALVMMVAVAGLVLSIAANVLSNIIGVDFLTALRARSF